MCLFGLCVWHSFILIWANAWRPGVRLGISQRAVRVEGGVGRVAGRPGEWESMERSDIERLLIDGGNVLVMQRHKTAHKYGALGRYIPPGNIEAMDRVLQVHPASCALFLAPTSATGARVCASNLLGRYGDLYTPGFQRLGPTLQRKYFHRKALDESNQGKAFQMLADMDGHSVSVAKSNYVCAKLLWCYYVLRTSIRISYVKIFNSVWTLIMFRCVVASMGLFFLMDCNRISYMKILFWYGF